MSFTRTACWISSMWIMFLVGFFVFAFATRVSAGACQCTCQFTNELASPASPQGDAVACNVYCKSITPPITSLKSSACPTESAPATGVCKNCVCANGAAQGELPSQGKCEEVCKGGGSAFKSCDTSAATAPPPENVPTVTPAKECDCFCTSEAGAKLLGKKKSIECSKTCKSLNEVVAACAYTIDQYPDRSAFCFNADQCKKQNGVLDGKQARDCPPLMKYCYPDPEKGIKTNLNVAIGSLSVTGDIGKYINTVFEWMLGVGFTIVIVLIMVGGLQYTLGAANPNLASDGKKRITNAVTGFILLLCVTLIAKSVNPYLIRLKVPQMPMVRKVEIIKGAPCEEIEKEYTLKTNDGNDIPADQKKCGTSAKIISKKDGGSVVGGSTCDYTKCPNEGEGCLGSGANAKCLKCAAVIPGNTSNVTPSSQICSSLKVANTSTKIGGDDVPTLHYCFYTHDPTVILTSGEELKIATVTAGGALLTAGIGGLAAGGYASADSVKKMVTGACAESTINCQNIKTCTDYETKAEAKTDLVSSSSPMENFFLSDVWGDFNLKKLCEENPCRVKFKNTDGKVVESVAQTSVCQIQPPKDYSLWDSAKNDCVQKGATEVVEKAEVTKIGSCDPSTCKGKCLEDVAGNKACVASCTDLTDDNKLANGSFLKPTAAMCLAFNVNDTDRCAYTKDGDATSFGPNGEGSCVSVKIDCGKITECEDYDTEVFPTGKKINGSLNLEDLTGSPNVFSTVCTSDPCGIGSKTGKICKYDGGSDCESKSK